MTHWIASCPMLTAQYYRVMTHCIASCHYDLYMCSSDIYLLVQNSPLFKWFIFLIGGANNFCLQKSRVPTGRIGIHVYHLYIYTVEHTSGTFRLAGFQLFRPTRIYSSRYIFIQVVIEISRNPLKNSYMGVGISGTTWAIEMVHLSKFAEFHENLNRNTFNIDTQSQMVINVKTIIF